MFENIVVWVIFTFVLWGWFLLIPIGCIKTDSIKGWAYANWIYAMVICGVYAHSGYDYFMLHESVAGFLAQSGIGILLIWIIPSFLLTFYISAQKMVSYGIEGGFMATFMTYIAVLIGMLVLAAFVTGLAIPYFQFLSKALF